MSTLSNQSGSAPTAPQGTFDPPRPRSRFAVALLNVLLWLAILYLLLGRAAGEAPRGGGAALPLFLAGAIAVAYLAVAFSTPVLRYLRNLDTAEGALQYIERLRKSPPEIVFAWTCSHRQMRTRFVTETFTETVVEFGRPRTVTRTRQRPETYWETVITASGSEPMAFSQWTDRSPQVSAAAFASRAVAIDFKLDVAVMGEATERFNAQRQRITDENRGRDIDFQLGDQRTVAGFQPSLLALVDPQHKSFLLGAGVYILAVLTGFAWPYIAWFDRATSPAAYSFAKDITA